ncbi:serine--tRNA ligase [Candidatus Saccharibacteria bacterium]|nr:serine--tRNA ligase [Candidatus Saccharibacteria bacterium]
MLDINFIRENQSAVERAVREKRYKISIKDLLSVDDSRRELLKNVESLRQKKNEIATQIKTTKKKPDASLIEAGKKVKEELFVLEKSLSEKEAELKTALKSVPNVIFDDVPLGGEECSVEIKSWGEKKSSGVDHLDYATSRDWVDFDRGAKVAGSKFYYLKGDLALLENALIQYGLKKVTEAGFTFMTVPDLVSSKVLEGCGFNPRTSDQSDEYFVEGEDLALIATAEMPLTGYHMDEILEEKDLPLLYAGLSACFRKEAGTYGKHTRGLFRVHQFNKLEMYAFCLPEQSKDLHDKILSVEEDIWQTLGIPYRIINIAAGDLGAPAAKKYDIEYWSPADQTYRELTSCSNCTDFQARSLNIRVRKKNGELVVAHTLNGTAISLARTMVAVIENYAQKDGKLIIPEVLRPYLNNKKEL